MPTIEGGDQKVFGRQRDGIRGPVCWINAIGDETLVALSQDDLSNAATLIVTQARHVLRGGRVFMSTVCHNHTVCGMFLTDSYLSQRRANTSGQRP